MEYSTNIIVERKTIRDLEDSIIDNRYQKQRARMLRTGARCIYLVEDDEDTARY